VDERQLRELHLIPDAEQTYWVGMVFDSAEGGHIELRGQALQEISQLTPRQAQGVSLPTFEFIKSPEAGKPAKER
jgi:hypothetical protein